jgi:hypothetical protein
MSVGMMDGPIATTFDEAVAALPRGKYVHTFMQSGASILIGADWTRKEIVDALRGADRIDVTGEQAQGMKHGLAIEHPRVPGAYLFIETARRTDSLVVTQPAARGGRG